MKELSLSSKLSVSPPNFTWPQYHSEDVKRVAQLLHRRIECPAHAAQLSASLGKLTVAVIHCRQPLQTRLLIDASGSNCFFSAANLVWTTRNSCSQWYSGESVAAHLTSTSVSPIFHRAKAQANSLTGQPLVRRGPVHTLVSPRVGQNGGLVISMATPNTTLDTIQSNGQGRRIRPPDLTMADENRVPLNGRKVEKRESRLGLRGLFNRTKTIDDFQSDDNAPRSLSLKSTGFRTSLAEFSGWSQTLNSRRNDGLLQALRESATPEPPSAGLQASQSLAPTLRHMKSVGVSRPSASAATKSAWDPPPLVHHPTLTLSTYTVLTRSTVSSIPSSYQDPDPYVHF
jgi:hypothetical protein